MDQITVRKVNERCISRARERARERGISLNKVYQEALEKGLGVNEVPGRYNDLDKYAGSMKPDAKFERYLDEDLKQIDSEMWEK